MIDEQGQRARGTKKRGKDVKIRDRVEKKKMETNKEEEEQKAISKMIMSGGKMMNDEERNSKNRWNRWKDE